MPRHQVNFSKRIGVYFDRLLIFSPPSTRTFLQTRLSSHLPFLLPSLIVIYSPIKSLTIDRFDYLIQYHNLHFGSKYNFPVLKFTPTREYSGKSWGLGFPSNHVSDPCLFHHPSNQRKMSRTMVKKASNPNQIRTGAERKRSLGRSLGKRETYMF